jgi:hypothetical protein
MTARTYSTRRMAIVNALVAKINETKLSTYNNYIKARNRLEFFEDIRDLPAVCVVAGTELREYQAGGYRDRYLDVNMHIFLSEENALETCEAILEDLETLIEENGRLAYEDRTGATQYTHDITVLTISTDEGTLDPISIGEMTLRVHY